MCPECQIGLEEMQMGIHDLVELFEENPANLQDYQEHKNKACFACKRPWNDGDPEVNGDMYTGDPDDETDIDCDICRSFHRYRAAGNLFLKRKGLPPFDQFPFGRDTDPQ